MRKNYVLTGFIMAAMLLLSANLFATDYEVSGAGTSAVNGVYVENGTNDGKPKYEFNNNGTTYYLCYDESYGGNWLVGTSYGVPQSYYYIPSTSDSPPSDGWRENNGLRPAPTVSVAGPNLSRNKDIFYESTDNDGSIGSTITITLNLPDGDSFSGSNGTFSTANYTTANVPTGLSVSITKNSDTELSVALTGNASSHNYTNDISNMELTFLDAAFTDGDASAVNNTTQSNIEVDYGLPITSLTDLQNLSNTSAYWDEYIIQTTDIDASDTENWNSGQGFDPIGPSFSSPFTGGYNGGGHTIDGLYINRPDGTGDIALFGFLEEQAFIRNLGLTNVDITGDDFDTAALAGYLYASASQDDNIVIKNCYSTGNITGVNSVGGLIGGMKGHSKIEQSFSSCNVKGEKYVGGLVGYVWHDHGEDGVINSYSTGSVTRTSGSETSYGGFIGRVTDVPVVRNCYATGDVFESDGVAWSSGDKGFLGGGDASNFSANFFDSEASNQSSATGATAKTTAEMNSKNTFTNAGWDFVDETTNGTDDIWKSTTTYPHFSYLIPPTQACEVGYSDAGSGSMELSWTRGNGDGNAVFIKQGSSGTASPVDNEDYTANTEFGSGEQIGTSGWYCVYVGTGTSVTVTGLDDLLDYRVHVCEYNLGSIYYNNETSTNNPQDLDAPVAIELSAFQIHKANSKIILSWTTATETNTAGFNIYRCQQEQGEYERVNNSMVAAHGTASSGADYRYTDGQPLSDECYYKLQRVDLDGSTHFSNPVSTASTGVEEENIPEKYALHENFPNPFNPTTTLRYDLPQDAHVTLEVYNVQGQRAATLIDSQKQAGEHAYTWNAAANFSSGLYFIVMQAGEHVFKQKVSLVK